MRPIERGPTPGVYNDYSDAKQDLTNRLGSFCSYCERRIATGLAVEHIQPKGLPQYAHLRNEWTNFLLGCVNCNSAKQATDVDPANYYLPDRDNTFVALQYEITGQVNPAGHLDAPRAAIAYNTIELVALNRSRHDRWDAATFASALDRFSQRVQVWEQAMDALADYARNPTDELRRAIGREAASAGFFSIWMAAFAGVPEVRTEVILCHAGTAADCFDANTQPVSPRPPNGLPHGGKI